MFKRAGLSFPLENQLEGRSQKVSQGFVETKFLLWSQLMRNFALPLIGLDLPTDTFSSLYSHVTSLEEMGFQFSDLTCKTSLHAMICWPVLGPI